MSVLFIGCVAFILYTYVGYPLLLGRRARRRTALPDPAVRVLPPLTVVIPAYNERAALRAKIENVLASRYPEDRLKVIVIIDGATDGTVLAAQGVRDPRLEVIEKPQRQGKMAALNDAMRRVTTPVTVLTDAAELLAPDTLALLAARFNEPTLGAVSGELEFVDVETGVSQNLGRYWQYEKSIRLHEAAVGSVIGATGPIYALRTPLYRPLSADTILDDVAIPFEVVRQGYRVSYERRARATEHCTASGRQEFIRKRRTLAGNYQLIFRYPDLLVPFKSPIAWQFWSHKVFRLLVPYALLGVFIGSFGLDPPLRDLMISLQLAFYMTAAWSHVTKTQARSGWLALPYTFCLLNGAAVAAFFDYLSGRLDVCWDKVK